MTPPLPTPGTAPATARHPRGIFEETDDAPGQSTFRIFNCVGTRIEKRSMATADVDGQTWASLQWTLEHKCPADPKKHAFMCRAASEPESPPPLRVLR